MYAKFTEFEQIKFMQKYKTLIENMKQSSPLHDLKKKPEYLNTKFFDS
jgi:hypothetical protein